MRGHRSGQHAGSHSRLWASTRDRRMGIAREQRQDRQPRASRVDVLWAHPRGPAVGRLAAGRKHGRTENTNAERPGGIMKYDIIEIEDYNGKVKLVAMSRDAQKRETKPKTKAQGGAK